MDNEIFANLSPFRSNCGLAVVIFTYAWSLAWAIGNKNFQDNKSFCMIYLKKSISIILFFRFFNRKISLWAVLMQSINLLTLIANIFVYRVLYWSYEDVVMSKVFAWIYAINFFGLTALMVIDILIYMYTKWKRNRR